MAPVICLDYPGPALRARQVLQDWKKNMALTAANNTLLATLTSLLKKDVSIAINFVKMVIDFRAECEKAKATFVKEVWLLNKQFITAAPLIQNIICTYIVRGCCEVGGEDSKRSKCGHWCRSAIPGPYCAASTKHKHCLLNRKKEKQSLARDSEEMYLSEATIPG